MTEQPLKDIKVLDLSRVLARPWAAMLLTDLGAKVWKVENVNGSDDKQAWSIPNYKGVSAYYLSANRGKQGSAVELKMAGFELGYTSPAYRSVFGTNNGIGSQWIIVDGTPAQRSFWLLKMASGEVIESFELTEPDAGSVETTARCEGDHYVLNGTKTCEVILDNARVPLDAAIGGFEGLGFKTAMKVLNRGRLHISLICVRAVQRLCDESVRFAKDCKQFGKPAAEHQLVQAMLADSGAKTWVGRFVVIETARYKCTAARVTCKIRQSSISTAMYGCSGYTRASPRSNRSTSRARCVRADAIDFLKLAPRVQTRFSSKHPVFLVQEPRSGKVDAKPDEANFRRDVG